MHNIELRNKAMQKHVRLYEVAAKFGISDFTLSRMMRKELPEEQKEKALRFIDEIAEEHAKGVS